MCVFVCACTSARTCVCVCVILRVLAFVIGVGLPLSFSSLWCCFFLYVQIRKLRRELDASQEKVSALTTQLSANVSEK